MKTKKLFSVVFCLLLIGVNVDGMENTSDSESKKNIEISVTGLYPDDKIHVKVVVDNEEENQQSTPLSNISTAFVLEHVNLNQQYKVVLDSHITFTPPAIHGLQLPPRTFQLDDIYHCTIYPHENALTREEDEDPRKIRTDKVQINCTKKLLPDMMLIYRMLGYAPFGFNKNNILHVIFTYLNPHVESASPKFEPIMFSLDALVFLPTTADWILSNTQDRESSDRGKILLWNHKCMCMRTMTFDHENTNIYDICVSVGEQYMAARLYNKAHRENEVKIWHMTTGEQQTIPEQFSDITQLRFVDSTSLLVAGKLSPNEDCDLLGLWNVHSGHWSKYWRTFSSIHPYNYILSAATIRSPEYERIIIYTLVDVHLQKNQSKSARRMRREMKIKYTQESDSEISEDESNDDMPRLRRMNAIEDENDLYFEDDYSISLHRWNLETNDVILVKTFPDTEQKPMVSEDGTIMVLQEMLNMYSIWDLTSNTPIDLDHRIILQHCPIYISTQHKLLIFNPTFHFPSYNDAKILIWHFNIDSQEITPVQEIDAWGLISQVEKVTVSSDGQTIAVTGNHHSRILFFNIMTGEKM